MTGAGLRSESSGWFEKVALLDRLARERLEAVAVEVRSEGWKWLEVALDFPYGHTTGLRRVAPATEALSAADQAAHDALRRECDELEAQYENAEELPDDVDARLGEIEQALARFEDRAVRFDPEVIACGGAFVSLGASGTPKIERGFVRLEDLAPAPSSEAGPDEAPAILKLEAQPGGATAGRRQSSTTKLSPTAVSSVALAACKDTDQVWSPTIPSAVTLPH